MSTATPNVQKTALTVIKDFLAQDKMMVALMDSVGSHAKAKRLMRGAISSIQASQQLQQCTPSSIAQSIIEAGQIDLEINSILGHAYLVPYKRTCRLQAGYKGLIELVYRSNNVKIVKARCVRLGDRFEYTETPPELIHKRPPDEDNDAAEITHAYAWVQLKSGAIDHVVWSREKTEKHALRHSQAYKKKKPDCPWITHWGAMAEKTVLRQLVKTLPVSVQAQHYAQLDEYAEAGVLAEQREATRKVDHVDIFDAQVIDPQQQPPPDDAQPEPNLGLGELLEGLEELQGDAEKIKAYYDQHVVRLADQDDKMEFSHACDFAQDIPF